MAGDPQIRTTTDPDSLGNVFLFRFLYLIIRRQSFRRLILDDSNEYQHCNARILQQMLL